MKRIRFGTPEKHVPSAYCPGFHYEESPISYDISRISFRKNARGVLVTLPLGADEHIYGLELQLTQFDHKGKKITLRVNADPKMPTGDTHAPVPFLVSTRGYGIYLDTARYAEVYCGVVFCDKLLVAPIFTGETGRKVYLPTGAGWRDYFTKQPVESGWLEVSTTSIPVYERV